MKPLLFTLALCLATSHALAQQKDTATTRLTALITEAVSANPAVLTRKARLLMSERNEDTARYGYFPSPTVGYQFDSKGDGYTTYGISQPLWTGGRLDASHDKARIEKQIAAADIEAIRDSISVGLVEAVYNFLSAQARVHARNAAIARLGEHLDTMRRREASGISPESDLYLVEARMASERNQLSIAMAARDRAHRTIEQLLSRPVPMQDLLEIQGEAVALQPGEPWLMRASDFVKDALARDPELHKAQLAIDSAQKSVDIEKAALHPSIYARVEKNAGYAVDTSVRYLLVAEYSFGAGFSKISSIDAARATQQGVAYEYESTRLERTQQFQSTFSDYREAQTRYPSMVQAVDNIEKVASSYKRLFIAGKRSWLDLLNAENEVTANRIALDELKAYLQCVPISLSTYAGKLAWQANKT